MQKKFKIFFNYFLAPILMLWLCVNLYQQIVQQKNNTESWQQVKQAFYSNQVWKIIVAFFLAAVNWSIESYKWKVLIAPLQKISFGTAVKATLAGSSFAANTPNRIGEYFGRMIYLEEGKRLQSIALTIVGSFSQVIITLCLGTIGVFFYKQYNQGVVAPINTLWLNTVFYGTLIVTVIFLVIYFKISWVQKIVLFIPFLKKYSFFFQKMEELSTATLIQTLTLSLLRYLVFLAQYILVLSAFGVAVSFGEALISVMVLFLILAIIPSFVVLEAGIRGTVSIEVFQLFTTNTVGVMATGYFIWLINLMLPAVIGVLFLIGKKVFKK